MPIEWEIKKTPGGATYSRAVASGRITMADVEKLKRDSAPGGPIHGLPSVSINDPNMVLDTDARRAFSEMVADDPKARYGVVVTSSPMRVMMGFVLRLSGRATTTRLFADEAEATRWVTEPLESR